MTSSGSSKDAFADDVEFLKTQGEVIVLSDASGAKVAVMPSLQGRIMTSTTGGGDSFGWINRTYFEEAKSGRVNPHISPFGGEDRFWLGPEGGQFSIFFKKGDPFDFEHWKTPAYIDTESYDVVGESDHNALFQKTVKFENYSGTQFHLQINRGVELLKLAEAMNDLKLDLPAGVKGVALASNNKVTNLGANFSKQTGLLSIWILSMLNASPTTTVIIPVVPGDDAALGRKVNDDYFGAISKDRLKTIGDVVYFKADAKNRGKLGISPRRTKPIVGSYDSGKNVLTLCAFGFDKNAKDYVNSAWKHQEDPFSGDVVNSYNDGPPPTGGAQMGNFYEIESSSPAKELKTGESIQHTHMMIHLTGDRAKLDEIARTALGVGLDEIAAVFR
jgi:hypothetical protein